ncbi:PIG-L deacetylase family protein [Nocardia takedensis]|uniref:PIG-L deacetylase family protein n=1 Tax=Nocardia takedensis TaxID=259390 RepID=UPI003F76C0E4
MTSADTPSILTIMAHPDDAELWAGGTLALHIAAGATVTIAVPQADEQRMHEAALGAQRLGAHLHPLPAHTRDEDLRELLTASRPEVLITHRVDDVHPDHRHITTTVLQALPAAVIATGRPRRLYSCDTYNSLTLNGPVPADTIIDITTTFPTKIHALQAHSGTQPITDHFGPMAENLARLWGARIGTTYGEAFTALPILGRLPSATHL